MCVIFCGIRYYPKAITINGLNPTKTLVPDLLDSCIPQTAGFVIAYTVVSDKHGRRFYLDNGTKAQCEPTQALVCALEI